MPKIRVLIVDDATVVRRLVSDVLSGDPEIEVVGIAANGRIALQKIPQVNPDLVTLDVEMPELDGLATLKELRKTYPKLPVVMFSTLTARGAGATLDALALGANDYVTKPANVGSVVAAMQRVREELIPKIKGLCGVAHPASGGSAVKTAPLTLRTDRPSLPQRIDVVAVGVSTGGPNALATIFPRLPANFPVPIVVVQHMPPVFTKLLAERLNASSPMRVCEAADGQCLKPGEAYVAPGDFHLTTVRTADGRVCCKLNREPPENSCRPAVDVLFRSVAATFGAHALAVVLTGMGCDGLRGCRRIREAGGRIVVQDRATSVVWGMPGAVAEDGIADSIVPLPDVVPEVLRLVGFGRGITQQPLVASASL